MPPKKNEPLPANVHFGRVRNNLRMGVVGLPNVGKSSLFNLLTSQSAPAENFPFCTIDPNEARCAVPDTRYDYLCGLWNPPSTQPAYLSVTDIAGLIKGASEGAGLGNAFLSHIQAVDGIFHVVRVFEDSDIVHVEENIDAVRDLSIITSELCKKDLEFVKKAAAAEDQAVRKSGGKFKLSPTFIGAIEKLTTLLENDMPVRSGEWSTSEVELINEKMSLITTKPIVYLVNMSKADYLRKKNKWLMKIRTWIDAHGGGVMIPFSVEFEQEWVALSSDEERKALTETAGPGATSTLPKMITTGYKELNLVYFFTSGEKEVRAWTIYKGVTAPEAASVIHTDFGKAFIKAEVVSFSDYKELCGGQKGMAAIKAAGKYRVEGKTYIVQDGDIIYFQIGTLTAPKKK
ncbi:hypothetical protein BASA50_004196 [Batrachochytrium salamandrivorans]|uniref:Obg-like ATPase 1 n=1 Tax=Batrachochytrium salamandrivorans TaxID=1357716 RepID=A0ABQ8FGL5_9FUNG|nr:hypothetical protein BASA62_009403 [Batrachochytrium salamandrivorans]KAH6568342.1 hypothetical protein BASA60_008645 [Batrachochytrium salamandrivorans]KAH6597852.1 hypothetical protein BASA50_004196 [Batrachochytrium salamandrivorans]KAH6598795.1 hypothetical protein BASA61_002781 [Batrachochytrium salamandrivorans]KAH9269371.1 GTP-binding protein YchF [Batrachochytrium salamandrivorans]